MGTELYSRTCRIISLPASNGLRRKLAKIALFIYLIQHWVEWMTSSVILLAYFTHFSNLLSPERIQIFANGKRRFSFFHGILWDQESMIWENTFPYIGSSYPLPHPSRGPHMMHGHMMHSNYLAFVLLLVCPSGLLSFRLWLFKGWITLSTRFKHPFSAKRDHWCRKFWTVFLLHTLGCITSNDMVFVLSGYIEKCVKISGH